MIERLWVIHYAIKSGTYPSANKLKGLCKDQAGSEVTTVTLNRDIRTLRDRYYAPLKYDRGRNGYYYENNWDFPLNIISTQDVFFLSAAKTLLSGFQGSPLYEKISEAIDFVTKTHATGKIDLLNRIAIPPTPIFSVDNQVWDDVVKALQDNFIIEFDYNGRWETDTTHRRVHPYQLLLYEGMCYLYGYAEERKAERLFVLTRMRNLKITADHFELPAQYEFSARCGGGRFGTFASNDKDKYVIDFYRDARQYIKDRVWADDQKITDFDKEDRTRIQFTGTQFLAIQGWVLSQGGNAIPRKPKWLVEEWKNQISQMVKNTKK